MRFYSFVNFYVAGIRAGIQAGHACEEMWASTALRFLHDTRFANRLALEKLVEFAKNHKTWIVLSGGDHEALLELITFFERADNNNPWDMFVEPGLNNAITSVSIIVEERLYDDLAMAVGRILLKFPDDSVVNNMDALQQVAFKGRNYTDWELEFLKRKAACRLAD